MKLAEIWKKYNKRQTSVSALICEVSKKSDAAKTTASKVVPRQITVIGSRVDTLAAKGWPGHNVLDVLQWSAKGNIRWLDSAVRRGDEIYLATDPTKWRGFLDSLPNRPFSAFIDLEMPYLQSKGYIQQGLKMVPGPTPLPL